jgi:hypothetical protein
MAEADLSRLLADLSEISETLNRESDTINQLSKRFEERLRLLNVGLEVWCTEPLVTEATDLSNDEETYEQGSIDTELGWSKGLKEWGLYLRERVYRRLSSDLYGREWEPVCTDHQYPLREASRQFRIAALRHFPELLRGLTQEAEQAVKAIEDAKRFAELC